MLSALTGLSYWIAHSELMEDHRSLAWGSMIAVSVAKATLVVLFFMHLWWERAWKYVLTIPALIMGILLVILLVPDIALRTESYSKPTSPVRRPEVNSAGIAPVPYLPDDDQPSFIAATGMFNAFPVNIP